MMPITHVHGFKRRPALIIQILDKRGVFDVFVGVFVDSNFVPANSECPLAIMANDYLRNSFLNL